MSWEPYSFTDTSRGRQEEEHVPLHNDASKVEKDQLLQVPRDEHQQRPQLICSHGQGGQSGLKTPLLLEETEEVWHGLSYPQTFLQMHYREHTDWLHHSVVWELHRQGAQGPW